MNILKVEHIFRFYKCGDQTIKALDDVSFTVKKGEFIAIVGPSGSGKSTLLHALGGVDQVSEGHVIIDDIDLYALNDEARTIFRRRQIGLIYQFYNLIPMLDVRENILLPLLLDNQKVDEKDCEEMIRLLGLSDRKAHLPQELSGGQQQRVSIGRALIAHPALILADEPTGNLDSHNSNEIVDLLRYCNKKYFQSVILITHDMEIARSCDRILYLKDGKLVDGEAV
ncbi:MAG: ABC transporter ATP-binding protein [Erysipelotrichaceae bacterium]